MALIKAFILTEFPQNIQFQYTWRKYQQRVLDGLDAYIKQKHLHIIAPPGSGKTILGLEVAIRINQPTLVLAPTIAIRNQWIQRFCEMFLRVDHTPAWISRDVRKPGFLTVVTYQGLHAACNNTKMEEEDLEDEEYPEDHEPIPSSNKNLDQVVEGLRQEGLGVILVDEAHHLKNEWWQTLIKVKEGLKPIIVGLTATPPYDVSPVEWERYLELNGPVDIEISVPELVIEGDLSPHQDYVFFTLPSEEEQTYIREFRKGIEELFELIKNDETIILAIENHPAWINPLANLEWIYTNLSFYSACLIFLHANSREIPQSHLEIIGDKNFKIPSFDHAWAETLLDFYLYKEKTCFKLFEAHQRELENSLRRYGAIERRQINFSENRQVTSFLTSSIGKLHAIRQIVDFEYGQLRQALRMVILTDFIRKEFYTGARENTQELNRIGVMTIFEKLRRENPAGIKIGILTGSIVIIPKSAYPAFEEKIRQYGIENISRCPVPYDEAYVFINQTEQMKHEVVHVITHIFQMGEIEVLIGTKSLLGEGWDAPAINALVLASFVGSFVLSNQMRGRAIRTQKGNPNKTGNIWHLACIDPTSPTDGPDVELLKRRFRSFVGVSFKKDGGIENGIGRLNIPEHLRLAAEVDLRNGETFRDAADRESLKENWDAALGKGVVLVEEIKIPFLEEMPYKAVKKLYLNKTIANLIATLGFGLMIFLDEFIQPFFRSLRNARSMHDVLVSLLIFAGIGIAIFGRLAFKTLRLYIKYRDISKDIQHIGEALLSTLVKIGVIRTDPSDLRIESSMDPQGAVFCHLEGGTTFERSSFIHALLEVVSPIDNPRYVIIRKGWFMSFIKQVDYHTVPELIGRNKAAAVYFKDEWTRLVGPCDLVFARSVEGRKILLKSRIKSLAAQFENNIERINEWRK